MSQPDFSRRSDQVELMDGPCDYASFEACLADLSSVNRLTLAHRPTLAFLERLRRQGRLAATRPVAILDVGSGQGDLLRAIDRWADAKGLPVALTGLDLSPWAAAAARNVTSPARPISWITADIFDYRAGADIVVSSLFTHHLDDRDLVRFLGWMERNAALAWFVNDLRRSRISHFGFKRLAAAMRWHRFVQHDGPLSIARAFTVDDWRGYLRTAGVSEARIRRRFPFRICIERERGGLCATS